MPAIRRRRIVKRTSLALMAVVLLMNAYVGIWIAASRAFSQGAISVGTARSISPAFAPLVRYCESDLPGARWTSELWWNAIPEFNETGSKSSIVPGEYESVWRHQKRMLLFMWIERSPLAPPMPR